MENSTRTVISTSKKLRKGVKTQMVVYKTPYGSKGKVTSVTKHEAYSGK
ncbi:MAG: hypothetical protein V4547_17895 [Bacteroidota bacterium]